MSYDLFFNPRAGTVTLDQFTEYFRGRPHYQVEARQAVYGNEDTGVYFVFDLADAAEQPEEPHCLSLNLNYFRPSFFGLEAEPEVAALARAFDLTVSDPQAQGMGEGEYSSELFLSGWNHGNELGYSAILREPQNRNGVACLPTRKLIGAWEWNRSRAQLQDELGESKFVPMVMFLLLGDKPVTAAVWGDGIPIAVPDVDCFIVVRKALAPRRFLRRVEDRALLTQQDALAIFSKHRAARDDGRLVLSYNEPPADVTKFVQSLPSDDQAVQRITSDRILDQELVEKCVAAHGA